MAKASLTTEDALKLLKKCCPEIFENNEVEIFCQFFCPISIIEADVKEYIIDEYDSVELLVLRLYSQGIRDVNIIENLTGIDIHMLEKILKTEIYTYGHINPNTGELTEAGKQTLDDNNDIEKLFQHALYDVKRELQADSLTGTIIKAGAELVKEKMVTYSDSIQPNILPQEAVVIDSELEKEIQERLEKYIKDGYLSDGNTIKKIGNLRSKEIRYRVSYFVKMKNFKYPFVAIWFSGSNEVKSERVVLPVAVARSDAERFDYSKRINEYLVREDAYFDYLSEKIDIFHDCSEMNAEMLDFLLSNNDYNDSSDSNVVIADESRDVVDVNNG